MRKKLETAITWLDMMVHNFGLECETATFIHNILIQLYSETPTDGTMIWDKEMIERAYPLSTNQIKQEQLEKILGIIRYEVPDFINRRLKDGK